jgi:hypothetical protein
MYWGTSRFPRPLHWSPRGQAERGQAAFAAGSKPRRVLVDEAQLDRVGG